MVKDAIGKDTPGGAGVMDAPRRHHAYRVLGTFSATGAADPAQRAVGSVTMPSRNVSGSAADPTLLSA
jgi:hypothetical protein